MNVPLSFPSFLEGAISTSSRKGAAQDIKKGELTVTATGLGMLCETTRLVRGMWALNWCPPLRDFNELTGCAPTAEWQGYLRCEISLVKLLQLPRARSEKSQRYIDRSCTQNPLFFDLCPRNKERTTTTKLVLKNEKDSECKKKKEEWYQWVWRIEGCYLITVLQCEDII